VKETLYCLVLQRKHETMRKVLFIDLLNLFWDHHGIYSLTAVMKKNNIDVHFAGTRNFKKALSKIEEVKPDLVLYSTFSTHLQTYKNFDKIAKQRLGIKSLIGGPAATFDWKLIKDSTIDAICVGEGEYAIVDFINNDFTSNKNIFYREENFPEEFYPLVDLDSLPLPDRDVVYQSDSLLRNMPSRQFFSARGCPYKCTYCFNHKFNTMFKGCGPIVRRKSVDYLFEEIKAIQEKYSLVDITFNDDLFVMNKKWFLEFAERFPKEIGLTYTCKLRANFVDEDIAKALKQSKCRNVNWSIESANDYLRNEILKRNMSKEQMLDAANILNKYGIPQRIALVIGLPGETFEQVMETLDFTMKTNVYMAHACIFDPFSGLELTDYAIEHGYLDPDHKVAKDFWSDSVLNYSRQEKNKIYKTMCLFPLFTTFRSFYYNKKLFKFVYSLPRIITRLIYEAIWPFKMAKLYVYKTPFVQKLRIVKRYLINQMY